MSDAGLVFGSLYSDRTTEVFNIVRDAGRVRIAEVASSAGLPENAARVYLGRLVKARWLHRPSRGIYEVAPEAPEVFAIEDYETGERAHAIR